MPGPYTPPRTPATPYGPQLQLIISLLFPIDPLTAMSSQPQVYIDTLTSRTHSPNLILNMNNLMFMLEHRHAQFMTPHGQYMQGLFYRTLGMLALLPLALGVNVLMQRLVPGVFGGRGFRVAVIDGLWYAGTGYGVVWGMATRVREERFRVVQGELLEKRNKQYLLHMARNRDNFGIPLSQQTKGLKIDTKTLKLLQMQIDDLKQGRL